MFIDGVMAAIFKIVKSNGKNKFLKINGTVLNCDNRNIGCLKKSGLTYIRITVTDAMKKVFCFKENCLLANSKTLKKMSFVFKRIVTRRKPKALQHLFKLQK
jgi:hypothetical protein